MHIDLAAHVIETPSSVLAVVIGISSSLCCRSSFQDSACDESYDVRLSYGGLCCVADVQGQTPFNQVERSEKRDLLVLQSLYNGVHAMP